MAKKLQRKVLAKQNDEFFEKQKIKVGKNASAHLTFYDSKKEILILEPNSFLKIPSSNSSQSNTKLALYGGNVNFKIKKLGKEQSFSIRTPSAVAGVRSGPISVPFTASTNLCGNSRH